MDTAIMDTILVVQVDQLCYEAGSGGRRSLVRSFVLQRVVHIATTRVQLIQQSNKACVL